jgi:hypothetical protein
MNPKIGGGYRRYSQPLRYTRGEPIPSFFRFGLDLESLCLIWLSGHNSETRF